MMSREGHGPSQSTCKDCYSITSSIANDYLSYYLKVTGRDQFQGFLLYVQDAANNTVGSFRTFDRDLFEPVECQEAAEFDLDSTIGHSNPIMKRWPVEFGWTAAVTEDEASKFQPGDKLTVRGMVVVSIPCILLLPARQYGLTFAFPDGLRSLAYFSRVHL
jgi:Reeler domain